MFHRRFFTISILAVAMLFLTAVRAEEPAELTTRIFYLQNMEPVEAVTMLRQKVQARRVAEYYGHDLIVVTDSSERVDRSEELLREAGALERTVDPHEPLDPESRPEDQVLERSFVIKSADLKTATLFCRALYQMRDVTEDAAASRLTLRDSESSLSAVEALFRELNLLAEDS